MEFVVAEILQGLLFGQSRKMKLESICLLFRK